MPSGSIGSVVARADRFGVARHGVLPAAVVVAAIVAAHGTVHALPGPGGPHHVSSRGILLALWGLTMVLAVGGLVALGWAYTALVRDLEAGPELDIGILPTDERAVLEPVIEGPGVTQVEVVDRSEYSDAKVSQTLKALRERGLVYREPQGRTYRLYPGSALERASESP